MAKSTEPAAEADEQAKRAGRPSPKERIARGKAARAKVPLEAHADFRPAPSRDPVALLMRQAETRVPELVPIRHGRMLVSPFAFYRGAAIVMAGDLATTSTPGLRTQLCGDAHLSNFGAYASAERRLVFDINDFDETVPGPFEWDVKRLAASFVVAGREAGFRRKDCRRIAADGGRELPDCDARVRRTSDLDHLACTRRRRERRDAVPVGAQGGRAEA